MILYAADSSAAAVYNFDLRFSHNDMTSLEVIMEAHVRIKILNSNGF